jgi:hypothetical protein
VLLIAASIVTRGQQSRTRGPLNKVEDEPAGRP